MIKFKLLFKLPFIAFIAFIALMLFSAKSFSVEISEDQATLYKYYEAIAKLHILNDRINEQYQQNINKNNYYYGSNNFRNKPEPSIQPFQIIRNANGSSTIYNQDGSSIFCMQNQNRTYCQ